MEALIDTPLKIIGGVALSTLANLYHALTVEQTFFHRTAERGAVGNLLAKHLIVGIGMWIKPIGPCFFASARKIGSVSV